MQIHVVSAQAGPISAAHSVPTGKRKCTAVPVLRLLEGSLSKEAVDLSVATCLSRSEVW